MIVTMIGLGVFGPYLVGSVRLEQGVIYGLLIALSPLVVGQFRPTGGLRFMIPWVFYLIVATLGVLTQGEYPPYDAGDILGGLDNIVLPLALMLLIWSFVSEDDAERRLIQFCGLIAIGMALNGLLAYASMHLDLTPILRPFWASGEGPAVATSAAQMGRYSGMLNQPAEAGVLYSLAGIAAVYVWHHRTILLAAVMALIVLGGILTVSKVFVLAGLPMVVIYWIASQKGGRKVVVSVLAALLSIALILILAGWTGAGFLGRLFAKSDEGVLDLFSGGRFSADSGFVAVALAALDYNPISGVGAAGWQVAYDGAMAEFLVVGGVLGLLVFLVILAMLFAIPRKLVGSDRWFARLFAITVAIGSLGFSPLTANRVSTVSWVVVSLLVLLVRDRQRVMALDVLGTKRHVLHGSDRARTGSS